MKMLGLASLSILGGLVAADYNVRHRIRKSRISAHKLLYKEIQEANANGYASLMELTNNVYPSLYKHYENDKIGKCLVRYDLLREPENPLLARSAIGLSLPQNSAVLSEVLEATRPLALKSVDLPGGPTIEIDVPERWKFLFNYSWVVQKLYSQYRKTYPEACDGTKPLPKVCTIYTKQAKKIFLLAPEAAAQHDFMSLPAPKPLDRSEQAATSNQTQQKKLLLPKPVLQWVNKLWGQVAVFPASPSALKPPNVVQPISAEAPRGDAIHPAEKPTSIMETKTDAPSKLPEVSKRTEASEDSNTVVVAVSVLPTAHASPISVASQTPGTSSAPADSLVTIALPASSTSPVSPALAASPIPVPIPVPVPVSSPVPSAASPVSTGASPVPADASSPVAFSAPAPVQVPVPASATKPAETSKS